MIKFNNLFKFIFIQICIIVVVRGLCSDVGKPVFTILSDSYCVVSDTATISNDQTYTLISISGNPQPEFDNRSNRVLYHFYESGSHDVNYTYFDPQDNSKVCNGTTSFQVLVPKIVYQPKCPGSVISVNITGARGTQFGINGGSKQTSNILTSSWVGKNVISTDMCTYNFEVVPTINSSPIINVKPQTCGLSDGTITISNANDYSLISMYNSNGETINSTTGTFAQLSSGNFKLNFYSTKCGQQIVQGSLNMYTPPITPTFTPFPCNSTHLTLTLKIDGFPNAVFNINGNPIDGSTTIVEQGIALTLSWQDSVKTQCSQTTVVQSPQYPMSLTYSVNPPISTISNPSIVTLTYSGNYSSLKVENSNGETIDLINTNQFQTIFGPQPQYYFISSTCYKNNLMVPIPSMNPIIQSNNQLCLYLGTIQVLNYQQFSTIYLFNSTNSLLQSSTNGYFQNVGSLLVTLNTTDKISNGTTLNYSTQYSFNPVLLKSGLITFDVEYITLATTCNTQGSLRITPIYNQSIRGLTTLFNYQPGQQLNVPFSDWCGTFQWTVPTNSFNLNQSITYGTPPTFTLTSGLAIQTVQVNGGTATTTSPYTGQYGSNSLTVTFTDSTQCTTTFNIDQPSPTIIPIVQITNQSSINCGIANGQIEVTNKASFTNLKISGLNVGDFGVWTGVPSGDYILIFNTQTDQGSINIHVPTNNDVIITTITQSPNCFLNFKSRVFTDGSIKFQVKQSNSQQSIPILNFIPIISPLTNGNGIYYPGTNQLAGSVQGNYSGYIQSNNCQWVVNFNISPISPLGLINQITFPINVTRNINSNGPIVKVGNLLNVTIDSVIPSGSLGGVIDSTNYLQVIGYNDPFNIRYDSLTVNFNAICKSNPLVSIDPISTYKILPSGKCSTFLIKFNVDILANSLVLLDDNIIVGPDPIELVSNIPHNATFKNYFSGLSSQSIQIQQSSFINYTFIPSTCWTSSDARLIINNPLDPSIYYKLTSQFGYTYAFNPTTHSFDGLSGQVQYSLSAVQTIDNQTSCLYQPITIISPLTLYSFLVPVIKTNRVCVGQSKGSVQIGVDPSQGQVNGVYIINNITYTSNNIPLPIGDYQVQIKTMSNGQQCSLDPNQNQQYQFSIIQNTQVTLTKQQSNNDCKVITIQVNGGDSSSYTYQLFDNKNQLLNSTISTLNQLTIPFTINNGNFIVQVIDGSGCLSNSIPININCPDVSIASTNSISIFLLLLSFIIIILN